MASGGTKQQILNAAEQLISQKGGHEWTISRIARAAGIAESVIYHHFKNKEDLLFSITGSHMTEVLSNLEQHLEGIPDPLSRLSKMVWFHVHYNETHKEYHRILLFECRSNRNFYHHETYKLIRRYAKTLSSILWDGVNAGVFQGDADMRVMRDLVLGGLDWETLGSLTGQNPDHAPEDIQKIMDLVCGIIGLRRRAPETGTDKSTRILISAEKLFSERGYRHTSISEIAHLARVAEGTVYEYFKNKEDLLFSIPKSRFNEHIQSLDEMFQIKTPLKKLRRFMRNHFYLYLTRPEFLRTFLLDIQLNPRFYRTEALTFFQEYGAHMDDLLTEGKKDGSIHPFISNSVFKNFFFGGFCHVSLRWLILDTEPKADKMAEIDQLVNLLSRAVANENQCD